MPRVNLEGSSSIVTGGASGIGEACARQLAELGSKVVIADLNESVAHKSLTKSADSLLNAMSQASKMPTLPLLQPLRWGHCVLA